MSTPDFAALWAELRAELGTRRATTYEVAADLDDEGQDGAERVYGRAEELRDTIAYMDQMAEREGRPVTAVPCPDGGCPIPVCDECRRYYGYTRIHVVDGVCSFGHRASLPALPGSEPDAIDGTLAPEDQLAAEMRSAGWPVVSAAETRRARYEAEQWARDFAAACRAQDPIVIDLPAGYAPYKPGED